LKEDLSLTFESDTQVASMTGREISIKNPLLKFQLHVC